MKLILAGTLAVMGCLGTGAAARAADEAPLGHAVIRGPAGPSEIVITTTPRLAGAIHSLTWHGEEFIDSTDHGRQLQSAANFDAGSNFTPETFNPTEAGSRADGAGDLSTSRLLHLIAADDRLQTTSRMAFWLQPGERSRGNLAKNIEPLSNHTLTKRVRIGFENLPHVIQYQVTFGLPVNEHHTFAQFEAVTGYLPARFQNFWKYDAKTESLEKLGDGPGEQSAPVVLATATGSHAMGIFSPDQPSRGFERAGYGRFRFAAQRVTKWNCVFRLKDPAGVAPGDYAFRCFVIVGDLETVRTSLAALHARFRNPSHDNGGQEDEGQEKVPGPKRPSPAGGFGQRPR